MIFEAFLNSLLFRFCALGAIFEEVRLDNFRRNISPKDRVVAKLMSSFEPLEDPVTYQQPEYN